VDQEERVHYTADPRPPPDGKAVQKKELPTLGPVGPPICLRTQSPRRISRDSLYPAGLGAALRPGPCVARKRGGKPFKEVS